jgi:UDP-N-acetyl-D-mannosaminuronate dehydrogenase
MPEYVFDAARAAAPAPLRSLAILGMTFKAECDDERNSLSFKLRKVGHWGFSTGSIPFHPIISFQYHSPYHFTLITTPKLRTQDVVLRQVCLL